MTVTAETIIAKTGEGIAGNVCQYDASGQPILAGTIPGLSVPKHDYIELGYTGSDLTSVVYKTGGSGGTTVATLTLAYNVGVLQSVTRT